MKKASLFLTVFGLVSSSLFANQLLNTQSNLKTNEFNKPITTKIYYQITVSRVNSVDFGFTSQVTVRTEKGWFTQDELQSRIDSLYVQYQSSYVNGTGTGYFISYSVIPFGI